MMRKITIALLLLFLGLSANRALAQDYEKPGKLEMVRGRLFSIVEALIP